MSFLLDTNAVSEWTKPKPDPGLAAWLGSTDEELTLVTRNGAHFADAKISLLNPWSLSG